SATAGETLITFQHRPSTNAWTATASTTPLDFQDHPREVGPPIFNILSPTNSVTSDLLRQSDDGRVLRALTAPFQRPEHSARNSYGLGDPPRDATQSLWIDANSLLPVRWEVAEEGRLGYELVFNYKPLDLQLPDSIARPTCIPTDSDLKELVDP